MFDTRPEETKYIYTDNDGQGKQLNGQNSYSITFPKGQLPPVKGFWSVTLYNAEHFFNPNPLKRYSLGTKNKDLKYNSDGSLTLYASANSPPRTRKATGYRLPKGRSRSISVRTGPTRRSWTVRGTHPRLSEPMGSAAEPFSDAAVVKSGRGQKGL